MAGFNFGKIGNVIGKFMDTDLMDIGRRRVITNPDGSTGETRPEDPLYLDVPCHIEFNESDNPNPESIDMTPIIISITLHCDINIDLEKGDYVYAKKMDSNGKLLDMYTGIIGEPIVEQSRKSAIMAVR